jgi:sugar phosphate isomerase/epimerase
VLPAGLEENVRALAGQVDAVQLLFFESKARSRLSHQPDIDLLSRLAGDQGLSYTVHLPLDLQLGSNDKRRRQEGIDEVCRLLEETGPLNPLAFDLHLDLDHDMAVGAWQDNLRDSLQTLAHCCGHWQEKIGIENIGYDFALVEEIISGAGFGFCVDFGHALRYNHQSDFWALPHWRHIHLHGASPGRDHRPFRAEDGLFLRGLGQKLVNREYRGVVTLELYDLTQVCQSLAVLHEAWQPFQDGEKV